MAKSMKERWELISSEIERAEELLHSLKEKVRIFNISMDYNWSYDEMVEEFLNDNPTVEIPYYPNDDDNCGWEGIWYICGCIADYRRDKYGYYFSSDTEEELECDDAFNWFTEAIGYNVQMMSLQKSIPALENKIEEMIEERQGIISNYEAEYEAAYWDLYYGYGYCFWHKTNGEYFDNEEDAKFVWNLAFEKITNED